MAEVYTHGHHEAVLRSHTWRTAENSAAYLLPHLRAGLDLLDVGALRAHLAARGGDWEKLLTTKNLRFAVNQDMARADTPVHDGDEVAFLPPVSGG